MKCENEDNNENDSLDNKQEQRSVEMLENADMRDPKCKCLFHCTICYSFNNEATFII